MHHLGKKSKMKSLLEKDKKRREKVLQAEKRNFILKSILKNINFFTLIRWNAYDKLANFSSNSRKTRLSNRCQKTISKKRLNKLTHFSRHILLKLIRSGKISNVKKASW